ncbi:MAG: hypothetical protein KH354_07040 [Clostridiales bacterium]|nr:hypothetical protein [Clostridiales bacterium]
MKKFIVAVLAIAMVSMISLVAFAAYPTADNGDKWIENATTNADGSVTFTISENEFVNMYAPNGYHFAVFDQKPSVEEEGDKGFWEHYNGTGAVFLNAQASGTTQTVPNNIFEKGKTYYVALCGLDVSKPYNWIWSTKLFSFTYTGEIKVSDAQSLVDAIADGNTIVLNANLTQSITIPDGVSVTLDLNGHTLTNTANQHTITNNGVLTILDNSQVKNGAVDNVSHARAAVYNSPTGTAKLLSGSFTRSEEKGTFEPYSSNNNSFYTIQNQGVMAIGEADNSTINIKANGGYSSLIANGYSDGSKKAPDAATPTLTINGGSFSGGINTVKNDETGVLVINDGTFNNYAQHSIMNWNIGVINGGTFNAENTPVLYNGVYGSYAVGDLSIIGGIFKAGTANIFANDAYSAPAKVSGGEFSAEVPASYIVAGMTSASLTTADATTYYIGTAQTVSEILAEKAANGDTITVQQGDADLSNVTNNVTIENKGDGSVTVNGSALENGSSIVTHKHNAQAVAAKKPTATEDGNIAYWHCADCNKYFSDEALTTEIELKDTVIPATGEIKPTNDTALTLSFSLLATSGLLVAYFCKRKKTGVSI